MLTRQAIFNAGGKASGTLFTDCANVGKAAAVFKATLQCSSTYRFGDGQIVSTGVVRLGSSGIAAAFPIVGGTGAYTGVRGEAKAGAPVKGFDSVDVLRFTN